jgi:hypothetical protein
VSVLVRTRLADSWASGAIVPIRTPLLLSAWSLTVAGLVFLDAPAAVRAPLTIGFVLVGPGLSIVRLVGVGQTLIEVMLATALSLALALLLAGTLLFAGVWSPRVTFALLLAITISGNLAETMRALRRRK